MNPHLPLNYPLPQIIPHIPQNILMNQYSPIITNIPLITKELNPKLKIYGEKNIANYRKKAEKMNRQNDLRKVKITQKEISDLLTQDSYYRKLKEWPLLTFEEISPICLRRKIDEMFHTTNVYMNQKYEYNVIRLSNISENIDKRFPNINKLLIKYKGHLVASGGAVLKSIFALNKISDVDLFFYNLTIEEAEKIRIEAIEFLIKLWDVDHYPSVNYHIKRNKYTTTLYVICEENDIYEYQFIHRIYPNMSSIIGGFDLSICMAAYDGEQLYATPLGAWSIKNLAIIIDTKRRSTSFEYRLQKYQMYGFTLIFPGISSQIIRNFHNNNNMYLQMIDKISDIANDYGYRYNENCEDFEKIGAVLPEYSKYNLQKKQNILPYFKLDVYNKIDTPLYDRENIEDRLINKISDYSSLSSHPDRFADINAQQLRSDNLHSVCSILKLDINKNIKDQLINDINNPNLMIDDLVFAKFNDRVEKLRKSFKREGYDKEYNENIDFYRLLKYFGKLTPDVIEKRDTDEYYEYRDIMINKMKTNANICKEKLIGIKWITQNAGRQWTSSINPIIADPREWYGKHYDPVITGIPSEIETAMRLMRLPKTESVWSMINNDIFNVICLHLLKKYADDAWDYIK